MTMKRFSLLVVLFAAVGCAHAAELELRLRPASESVTLDPFDGAWSTADAVEVALMPQTIAPPGGGGSVKTVRVQALQAKQDVFFRLEWSDGGVNDDVSGAEGFSDAVALQFPAQPEVIPAPFMGDKDNAVAIWRWSAAAQKDLDGGYRANSELRPRTAADLYPYADDTTFRAGEKAGNIVSQRRRASAVESLAAKGFGTLMPTGDQPVQGRGVWKDGRWHVVMRRGMTGTPTFSTGSRLVFAVAAWDGSARERNGVKSVSVWHALSMPGAAPRGAETATAQGQRVFQRYGCAVCHGKDGSGGVPNPNAQTNPIPPLIRVKEGFTKAELLAVILKGREPAQADPTGPPARFKMNAWGTVMGPEEADALVEYLYSLMPKKTGQEW